MIEQHNEAKNTRVSAENKSEGQTNPKLKINLPTIELSEFSDNYLE